MSASDPPVDWTASASLRRHDLDALRAFAMLLGIALHASLSFSTLPWIVHDTRQSELYSLFMLAVHGFRMPLFFLVSGFFTAMLWRKRGLAALLKQRAVRILIPCLVGLVTIIPMLIGVSGWAIQNAVPVVVTDDGSIIAAVRLGDAGALRKRAEGSRDLDKGDGSYGVSPLSWAAMLGEVPSAEVLIEAGANVNARNPDASTPLHSAALFGRTKIVAMLVEHGADANARSQAGQTPLEAATIDWGTTQFIARLLQIPIGTEAEVNAGRAEVRRLLEPITKSASDAERAVDSATGSGGRFVSAYKRFLDSERFSVEVAGGSFNLFRTPVFHHLWFLWFLCWLVPIFALFAWGAERLHVPQIPRVLLHAPVCYLWLIPLTLIPQWFMGIDGAMFGPDTSTGILLMPHVLLYYAVFFGFGAVYYDVNDDEGRLGRRWWLLIPFALIIALPTGLVPVAPRFVRAFAQVVYAWAMNLGMLGLFRRVLKRERSWVRYVSDASYWLYFTHVPLVIAAQVIVAPWPLPSFLKFILLCAVVTTILLLSYQFLVRYTWIGRVLNGPRTRPRRAIPSSSLAEQTVGAG